MKKILLALTLFAVTVLAGCAAGGSIDSLQTQLEESAGTVENVTENGGVSDMNTTQSSNATLTEQETPDALYESFQKPDQDLKTKPLFFWNVPLSEMTTDKVRQIVRKSYEESGYDGFGILPYWLDGYMTEEYFELYEAALDEGSKYGMKFSLYDEDGFPSYTAGGLFAEKYPELTARRLDMIESEGKAGDNIFVQIPSGTLMGAVALNVETGERFNVTDLAHIVEVPDFDASAQPLGALASSTYDISPGYGVDKAFDGNAGTRWNAYQHSGSRAWIQINYGKTVPIDGIEIYEDRDTALQRVSAFDVQILKNGKWETVASGEKITDRGVKFTFDTPLETQFVRLYLRRIVGDSATVSEFVVSYKGERLPIPESPAISGLAPGYYASSVYSSDYGAEKAFDGKAETRWNSADGRSVDEWIMVCYDGETAIDSAYISEALDRIISFRIEYLKDGAWTICASGKTIGKSKTVSFDEIETSALRLIVSTPNGTLPSIYEFTPKHQGQSVLSVASGTVRDYTKSYLEYYVPENAPGTWKVLCFVCPNEHKDGMDYLNPEAVAGYIEITHEAYYRRFKKYFENGTITSSFYDEPSFYPAGGLTAYGVDGARMWTDGFNDFFKTMYPGEDPVLLYPALWYDIGPDTAEARDKLFGVRSEMFAKNYIGQINEWCVSHGIKLMGHMLFEEMVNPLSCEGDLMLCFKYQEIPGVDCISWYNFSKEAYKIISSSANNWDKTLVMSETFGAMGADMPVTMLYRQTIDLFTKGINLIVPHAVWYDSDKNIVYPPELSYRNAKYASELSEYNDYVARLSAVLQKEGVHVADAAMLYPIDDLENAYYFNGEQNNPSYANYMNIGEYLSLTDRRDFTYLHPETLDRCVVEDGRLVLPNEINRESFRVFIVPGMKTIDLSSLEKIYEFWKAGGPVIFVGSVPAKATRASDDARVIGILTEMLGRDSVSASTAFICEKDGRRAYHVVSERKLGETLEDALENRDVRIGGVPNLKNGYVSYIHKLTSGRNIYYIGNSSDKEISMTVTLRGEFASLELWDPTNGSKRALETSVKDGMTTVELTLGTISSAFIVEPAD